jgi:hypothetical protein
MATLVQREIRLPEEMGRAMRIVVSKMSGFKRIL